VPPADENDPKRTIDNRSFRPDSAVPLTQEIEISTVQDASGIAFRAPTGSDRARQALPPESTVEPRCGSGLAVPAGLVGWLEPGNQAKGGEAW
jgi:hypothetical protein